MPAITPQFLFDLESRMRLVANTSYAALNDSRNLWWTQVAKTTTIETRKERLIWLLETLKIGRPQAANTGGQYSFVDVVSQTQEIEVLAANVQGLKMKREDLEDVDANGIDIASHWARQAGALFGYWPQKAVAAAIHANPTGYDTKAFFATDHPYNPYNTGAGTYANLFTSSASGIYPGAVPLSGDMATVVANVQKAVSYIQSLKQPNGEDPRFLRVNKMFVPPALAGVATQLMNAKVIAQAVGSAGGSANIEAVISSWNLGQPVVVPELGSAFGGSDTAWYLACEDILNNELGAFMYVNREPFSIIYHGPQTDAQLATKDEFQWTTRGRNVVAPGHPFLLFKCAAT